MPVTSFAPEFLELYRIAAQKELRLVLTNERTARRLRARLNSLRAAMREEKHPWANLANGVQLRVRDNVLVALPADHEFITELRNAGITVERQPIKRIAREMQPGIPHPEEKDIAAAEDAIKDFFESDNAEEE